MTAQHIDKNSKFGGVRTASFRHKAASQQRAATNNMDCGKLLADEAVFDTKLLKLLVDMVAKFDLIQPSLDGETARFNDLNSERVSLLLSEKPLRCQLQLRYEDRQKVQDSRYRLDWLSLKSVGLRSLLGLFKCSFRLFASILIDIVSV